MSVEENKRTALKMIAALEGGHLDETLVTPDVAWWVPGRGTVSKADFLGLAEAFRGLLKDGCKMTVHGVTAEGDRVAVEAESIAPLVNGKTYNNTYHFLFLFRDGKIYQAKEYNDSQHAAEIFGAAIGDQGK